MITNDTAANYCPTNLLCFALVRPLILMIDTTEVGHDDRNRKRDDQDAAERTNTTHYFPDNCARYHVTVPEDHQQRRHDLFYVSVIIIC